MSGELGEPPERSQMTEDTTTTYQWPRGLDCPYCGCSWTIPIRGVSVRHCTRCGKVLIHRPEPVPRGEPS